MNKDLLDWIKKNSTKGGGIICLEALERVVGCPRLTISHAVRGNRGLAKKWRLPVIAVVVKFGYKPLSAQGDPAKISKVNRSLQDFENIGQKLCKKDKESLYFIDNGAAIPFSETKEFDEF